MRFIFVLFFITCSIINAGDKKIILGSYGTKKLAIKSLINLEPRISLSTKKTILSNNTQLKIRKSGKMYIMVVEPVKDYALAKKIKSTLPRPFNEKAFISNYSKIDPSEEDAFVLNSFKPKSTIKNQEIKTNEIKSKKIKQTKEEEKIQISTTDENISINENISSTKENLHVEQTKQIPQEQIIATTNKDNDVLISQNEPKTLQGDTQKEKNTSKNPHVNLKNKTKETSFGFTVFAEFVTKQYRNIKHQIQYILEEYVFAIYTFLILSSILAYIISIRRVLILEKTIEKLQKEKEEKIILVQNLTLDINRSKMYYNDLLDSLKRPLKAIIENFNKPNIPTEELNAAKATRTLNQILTSHEEINGNLNTESNKIDLNNLVNDLAVAINSSYKNLNIVVDFYLASLTQIIGDADKIARIFQILLNFACKNTQNGRILLALNEANQGIDGYISISIVLKSNKDGFDQMAIAKLTQAFSSNIEAIRTSMDQETKELIIAKRLLETLNGSIGFIGRANKENSIIFDMELKVINQKALRDTFSSRKLALKSNILLLKKDDNFIEEINDILEPIGIKARVFKNWEEMSKNLQNIFLFADVLILPNSHLGFIDVDELIQKAKDKNFAILIVADESEVETNIIQKKLESEKYENCEIHTEVRKIKKPYTKEEFLEILKSIS